MTDRDREFLGIYRTHRFEEQRAFYASRHAEFETARDELVWLTGVFMVLTAATSAMASADLGGLKWLWSILAVVFPTLATALTAYNGLYAFERQAKLYRDAAYALMRARADSPDVQPSMDDAAFHEALSAHVGQVEKILGGEQAQWGQLIGEIKPIVPAPSTRVPE